MPGERILFVSSDTNFANSLVQDILEPAGYQLTIHHGYSGALDAIAESDLDFIFVEAGVDDEDVLNLIKQMALQYPDLPVVGFIKGEIEGNNFPVRILQSGGFDCLSFSSNASQISDIVTRGLEYTQHMKNWAISFIQKDADVLRKRFVEMESMLDRSGDGIIIVDDQDCLKVINRSARQIFGISNENITGKSLRKVISNNELLESLNTNEQGFPRKVEISPSVDKVYEAHVVSVPGSGKVITLHDITPYKELDRVKSEFVHNVSHDLRTPLTAIMGYIELIGRVGPINEQQKEFIQRVQTSAHHITDLISALLDLGRIEAGLDKQKEHILIVDIIKDTVEGLIHQIEDKEQKLVLEIPDKIPPILGNPIRLRQMLINLVDNASKYSPEGSRIFIRLISDDQQLILQVEDTGIGIPNADQPFIFNRLFRASNVLNDSRGTGLGLSIVRSIAENHGGRCWFETTSGKGTTFTVVLPVP
jgi:PAS domain S-box-containing protein